MSSSRSRLPWPSVRTVLTDPIHLLAFGFGSGLSRVAPGTAGSAAALLVFFALAGLSAWLYVAITVVVTVAGFSICGRSAEKLGIHDHPGIVWDEWAGLLITLAFLPVPLVGLEALVWVALGFALFRLFDIVKPWPARMFDRDWHDGVGIVMDDVVAGLYAGLALQLLFLLWNLVA